eukprot:jgi/Mesen1/5655/ME000286S04870
MARGIEQEAAAVGQLQQLMNGVNPQLKATFELVDCLGWRVKNDVDNILSRPFSEDKLKKIRATQLYGMTGFDKEGRPVLAIRVGLSSMDSSCKLEEYVHSHIQHNEYRDRVLLPKLSKELGRSVTTCIKVMDMTGLKLSSLARMKMQHAVASVDDLNYPEKAEVYYIVNSPSIFSTCWRAISPMLQERTRRKVQVLRGNGRDELLQVMGEDSIPSFIGHSPQNGKATPHGTVDSCDLAHPYHVVMQKYIEEQRDARHQGTAVRETSKPREVDVDENYVVGDNGEASEVTIVAEKALSELEAGRDTSPTL